MRGDEPHVRLDDIPEAISVHDLEGRYVWASVGLVNLIGIEPQDLIGRDAYDLFHPDDVPEIQVSHETVVALPAIYTVQYRIRRADGTYRWVETVSRLLETDGVIVAATRAIDDRASALSALEAERLLAERLRELGHMQDGFLTAIAHRTRHPLTVASGLAELLAARWQDLEPDRVNNLFTRLVANNRKLLSVLEDVTQAEQLTRRSQEVRCRPVQLRRIVSEQLEAFADATAPITVEIPDRELIYADPKLLALVVTILLNNASQHTPVGTPVWVRHVRDPAGTILIVEDGGDGIPEPSRQAVFEAFTRGDRDDPDPGLGLGLHTVAEIAAAHRGRAWVEERDGGGASFQVLFPAAAATHFTLDQESSNKLLPTRTILIVDDDPAALTLLRLALQADDYRTVTVDNGAEAITLAQELLPDAIVLDVMMPGLDGREVARTLRDIPTTRHIPIVICSALVSDRDQWEAQLAGADAFIAKPFDVEELTRTLAKAVATAQTKVARRYPT